MERDTDAYLFPVRLGTVRPVVEGSGIDGQLTFSTDWELKDQKEGEMHQQPLLSSRL
jgi:hypothetical protein